MELLLFITFNTSSVFSYFSPMYILQLQRYIFSFRSFATSNLILINSVTNSFNLIHSTIVVLLGFSNRTRPITSMKCIY